MPYVHVFENTVVPLDGGGEHRYRAGGPYCVDDARLEKFVADGVGEEVDEDFVPPVSVPNPGLYVGSSDGPKQIEPHQKQPKGQFPQRNAKPKSLEKDDE